MLYCLTLDQLPGSWRSGREMSGTIFTLASHGMIASQMMLLFLAFSLCGLFLRYVCGIFVPACFKFIIATDILWN